MDLPVPQAVRHLEVVGTFHNDTYTDAYAWMKHQQCQPLDTHSPFCDYVRAERHYFHQTIITPHRGKIQSLIDSMQQLSDAVQYTSDSETDFILGDATWLLNAFPIGKFWYYSRTEATSEMVYFRRFRHCSEATHCQEERLFSLKQFTLEKVPNVGPFEVCQDRYVAIGLDTNGSEQFTVHFIDLDSSSNEPLAPPLNHVYYQLQWTPSCRHVYFTVLDDLSAPRFVDRYRVLDRNETEWPRITRIFAEEDPSLTVSLEMTCNQEFMIIQSMGQRTSEMRLIADADAYLSAELAMTLPRRKGRRYQLDYFPKGFILLLWEESHEVKEYDAHCPLGGLGERPCLTEEILDLPHQGNGRLYLIPTIADFQHSENWLLLRHERPHQFLLRFDLFHDNIIFLHLNYQARRRLLKWQNGTWTDTNADDPCRSVYSLMLDASFDSESRMYHHYNDKELYFVNSSYVVPTSRYALNVESGVIHVLVRGQMTASYSKSFCEGRAWMESIPVTFLFQSMSESGHCLPLEDDIAKYGRRPVHLHVYGAYGTVAEASFKAERLAPLLPLTRIVYAFASVRGDGTLGAAWHLQAVEQLKERSIIDAALIIENVVKKWSTCDKVVIEGRSAGGLSAIGGGLSACSCLAGIVGVVPFIDPIGDMIDPSVAWTAYEWHEWGNPLTDASIYFSMKSYSPLDRLDKIQQTIPPVLVTGGLYDSRVPLSEPVRFVAKMRFILKSQPVYLYVSDGGHFETDQDSIFYERAVIETFVSSLLLS